MRLRARWSGIPTWTICITRPPRTIGMVSSRTSCDRSDPTVSKVLTPRAALSRASGESVSARDRRRSVPVSGCPSGSKSWKNLS